MESKLVKDFLAEQVKLMNAQQHARPAHKSIIRPDTNVVKIDPDDPESMFNHILEKKPAPKKVIKFLQACIDKMVAEDD
jgi:hypothetical protein